MFGFIKKLFVNKEIEKKKEKAVMDLAYFLTNYGFNFEEAVKVSKEFWKKYNNKLKEML